MLQDLKDFMAKLQEDEVLQARMGEIVESSKQEEVFDKCNAVAAEMGYTIVEDDMGALAEEYQSELSDEELDKVSGAATGFVISAIIIGSAIISGGASAVSVRQPWRK